MIHSVPDAGAPSDAIRITGLVQSFGPITAVNNINLAVPPGSFLVLVGPSGCGKSTLLRMLAGLDAPTAGEIAFMGRVVSSGTGGCISSMMKRPKAAAGCRNRGGLCIWKMVLGSPFIRLMA